MGSPEPPRCERQDPSFWCELPRGHEGECSRSVPPDGTRNYYDWADVREHIDYLKERVDQLEAAVKIREEECDEADARVNQLEKAIEHVVNDSPGTPESVKGYLRRALSAAGEDAPEMCPHGLYVWMCRTCRSAAGEDAK